jgi:hypothetical protein
VTSPADDDGSGMPRTSGEEDHGMQLFMDVHEHIEGLTADALAQAHQRDLDVQERYGVEYRRYWFDEDSGRVFCLVAAPDAATATAVHREAHGLVAEAVIPVTEGR